MSRLVERRRVPRVALTGELAMQLELLRRVRLLDISQNGALLESEASLPVGTVAQFRAPLAVPFDARLVVRRLQERDSDATAALGVEFMQVEDHSRQSLEQFLKKASH